MIESYNEAIKQTDKTQGELLTPEQLSLGFYSIVINRFGTVRKPKLINKGIRSWSDLGTIVEHLSNNGLHLIEKKYGKNDFKAFPGVEDLFN